MRDLGIWMYTLSRFAFYEYWMDCAQNGGAGSTLFASQSPNMQGAQGDAYRASIQAHAAAPVGFATQVYNSYLQVVSDFGFEPVYLTGISWLPFHGGSFYLSSSPITVTFSDRHQLKNVPAWGMSWGGVPHHR